LRYDADENNQVLLESNSTWKTLLTALDSLYIFKESTDWVLLS